MFLRKDDRLTLPIYEGGRRREEKRKERKGEEERATGWREQSISNILEAEKQMDRLLT